MELIFPENIYCISCNVPIRKNNPFSLCRRCYQNISFLKNETILYDKEVTKLLSTSYVEEVFIATSYGEIMKKLIHDIKFNKKTYLAKYFAQILMDLILSKNLSFDYLLSTPMHTKKKKIRGYNQVDLMVHNLSKMMGKEWLSISERVKNTKSLYSLSLSQRQKEMENAFETRYHEKIAGSQLLLIDDILTTGSTSLNLSKSIKDVHPDVQIKLLFLSRSSLK